MALTRQKIFRVNWYVTLSEIFDSIFGYIKNVEFAQELEKICEGFSGEMLNIFYSADFLIHCSTFLQIKKRPGKKVKLIRGK